MKVFVCHAREERDLAEAVALKLRQNGHEPFLARRDLQPGAAYDREIRRAVAAANRALVLVSKASMTPGRYTLSEVEMFTHRWADPTGRVVAFRVEDPAPHPIPPYLGNVTIGEVRGDPATDIVTQTLAALEGGGPEDPTPAERRGCLSFALSLGPLKVAISLSCLALLGGYGLGLFGRTPKDPDPVVAPVAFDVVLTGVHFRDSPTSAVRNAARTIEWRIDEPAFFTLDRSGRPDRRALHLPTASAVRSFHPKATGEPLSFPLDVRIPVTLAPGQTSTVVDVPFTLGVDGQSGVAGARPLRVRVERDPSGAWTAAYLDGPEVRGGGTDAPWTATLDLAVRANGAEVARPVAPAPPVGPTPPDAPPVERAVTVVGPDVSVGIDLRVGDAVGIAATGVVDFGGAFIGIGAPILGPAGDDQPTPRDYPAPHLRKNSLIGRVGDGPWFAVGPDVRFVADRAGPIVLRANDRVVDDNSRGWSVRVEVRRAR